MEPIEPAPASAISFSSTDEIGGVDELDVAGHRRSRDHVFCAFACAMATTEQVPCRRLPAAQPVLLICGALHQLEESGSRLRAQDDEEDVQVAHLAELEVRDNSPAAAPLSVLRPRFLIRHALESPYLRAILRRARRRAIASRPVRPSATLRQVCAGLACDANHLATIPGELVEHFCFLCVQVGPRVVFGDGPFVTLGEPHRRIFLSPPGCSIAR